MKRLWSQWMNRLESERARSEEERGSALLISLLIMVVLGLLGITFLVISDTEQAISVNQRDDQQVLYIGEGGVEVVKSWFDQPKPNLNPLVPDDDEVILDRRRGDSTWDDTIDLDGSQGDVYEGGTRAGVQRLFEKPYRGRDENTFWGYPVDDDGLGPDVVLENDPNDTDDYIDRINQLFNADNGNSLENALIEEIRIFRPPLAKDLEIRLGVATVEVVAVKRDRKGNILSSRTVRDVIQEFPYPGPRGAIESAGTIDINGNFTPHWGFVESEQEISPKDNKTFGGLPRDPGFPNGDDVRKFQDFSAYPLDDPQDWNNGNLVQQAGCQGADRTLIEELVGACVNGSCNLAANPDHIFVQDPWLVYRTATVFDNTCDAGATQPWAWDIGRHIRDGDLLGFPDANDLNPCPACGDNGDASNMMQLQPVKFPVVLYEPWKKAARSGKNKVYYYAYAGEAGNEAIYTRNGGTETRKMKHWINTQLDQDGDTFMDNEAGLHFFDTVNGLNPQDLNPDDNIPAPGILAEQVTLQKGGMGNAGSNGGTGGGGGANNFLAQGFIFVNAEVIDSTGVAAGVDTYVNMPGEPYLDVGIDLDGDGEICDNNTCCPANPSTAEERTKCNELDTVNNGFWDVELDDGCTPGGSTVCESDGRNYLNHDNWDDFIAAHQYGSQVVPHSQLVSPQTPFIAPQFMHSDHPNAASFDMEWPHEPYLNFRFPCIDGNDSGCTGAYTNPLKLVNYEVAIDFDAEAQTALERPTDCGNDQELCTTPDTTNAEKTSTGFDVNGSLFQLPLNLYGVMYSEGRWDGRGNLVGYGSLLMKEQFRGLGTIHMYFDESLIKDQWPPDQWGLPRVFSSSRETETNAELARFTDE